MKVTDDGAPALESTLTFSVVVAAAGDVRLSAELAEPGQLRLQLSGGVGRTYLIESSSDLVNWTTVTNLVSTAPEMQFLQPLLLDPSSQFFRALSP